LEIFTGKESHPAKSQDFGRMERKVKQIMISRIEEKKTQPSVVIDESGCQPLEV
jgi:hypothetical protein